MIGWIKKFIDAWTYEPPTNSWEEMSELCDITIKKLREEFDALEYELLKLELLLYKLEQEAKEKEQNDNSKD